MPLIGLNASVQMRNRKNRKFAAETMIQNPLITRPGPSSDWRAVAPWAIPPTRANRSTGRAPVPLRLCDEDRQDADDDGEHAEAFRERREDDREATNLSCRVRVTPDRAARHAGEDADADAGADDAQGRQARSDVFHAGSNPPGPGVRPGALGPWSVARGRACDDRPLDRGPVAGLVLVCMVPLDRRESEHERQHAEDQRLDRVEQDLEAHEGHGDDRDGQCGHDAERHLPSETRRTAGTSPGSRESRGPGTPGPGRT